ncbi:uncharacterized protein EV420DRAFT_1650380 [Desarmillaria tabescens]|uniref:Uncharacterized protein n=1 Tax=Armillaria tabescens TaxID=1929756 RepID=A0AA39JDP7_ARMTA|nr:uncharacterized protein EV420DRAFT_1650380 [Desarmillaria tabescens]KAK0440886.1 hypothetical protein EV420DRAFT_1650380 [Desarmillaria tabescens]
MHNTVRRIRYHPYAQYGPRAHSVSTPQPLDRTVSKTTASALSRPTLNDHIQRLSLHRQVYKNPMKQPSKTDDDQSFSWWKIVTGLILIAVAARVVVLIYGYEIL